MLGQKVRVLVDEQNQLRSYKVSRAGRNDFGRTVAGGRIGVATLSKNNLLFFASLFIFIFISIREWFLLKCILKKQPHRTKGRKI